MCPKKGTERGFMFEEKIQRLDEIVEALEQGNISLETALSFYAEGVKLVRACKEILDNAEQVVRDLREEMEDQ